MVDNKEDKPSRDVRLPTEKGDDQMHRLLLVGVLCLAGCQGVLGPLAPRKAERADDPSYSISEQQRRTRDRYALPDDAPTVSPRSEYGLPGVHGR